MAEFKARFCGKDDLHVPDDDCSECMRELEAFKRFVNSELAKRLVKENIQAGQNITITYDGNDITISSSGGGGGEELNVEMTDMDNVAHTWRVKGIQVS